MSHPAINASYVLLVAAIGLLGLVVAAGAWLARPYLLTDDPPGPRRWPGALHGAAGLAGFAVLVAALRGPPPSAHAVRMGAGTFGTISAALIAGGLLAGGVILLSHLLRRPLSTALVATHGMLAIVGYMLLVTYLTMLH